MPIISSKTSSHLLDTSDAAAYIGMSPSWLKASRFRPELAGPPFIKISRCVRYDPSDLTAWISERKFRGTHEFTSFEEDK